MIWVQRAAVDGRERACVDKGALKGVVDKEEEKHCEGEVRERICYCNASKSTDPAVSTQVLVLKSWKTPFSPDPLIWTLN